MTDALFLELVENTQELLSTTPFVNPIATAVILRLSLLSLHVMSDLVRAVRKGP